MTIIETDDFQKSLASFPERIQNAYAKQRMLFLENWRDPRLHIKKLTDMDGAYCFRVTRTYRTLFYFRDQTCVIFFMIDHRKDVYR